MVWSHARIAIYQKRKGETIMPANVETMFYYGEVPWHGDMNQAMFWHWSGYQEAGVESSGQVEGGEGSCDLTITYL